MSLDARWLGLGAGWVRLDARWLGLGARWMSLGAVLPFWHGMTWNLIDRLDDNRRLGVFVGFRRRRKRLIADGEFVFGLGRGNHFARERNASCKFERMRFFLDLLGLLLNSLETARGKGLSPGVANQFELRIRPSDDIDICSRNTYHKTPPLLSRNAHIGPYFYKQAIF